MRFPILAIDTATGPCSVAVWDGEKIAAYSENSKPVMQSASLMPMVENALKHSGMTYKDLGAVACTVGPGSFTGIRVGLASAGAIAFAAGIKRMGFTTLDVLAFGAREYAKDERVLAILNAGKGEWYYRYYDANGAALGQPSLAALEVAMSEAPGNIVVSGNAVIEAKGFSPCPLTFPRADALAALAASNTLAAQELRPFYIRTPDAKLPVKKIV